MPWTWICPSVRCRGLPMVCPECGGSGKVINDPCPQCAGSGRNQVISEAVVEFPAGSHDGTLVRIKGLGNAGTNGAAAGDLVGRARVAAERLGDRARQGFRMVGFALPFIILGIVVPSFRLLALVSLIPLVMASWRRVKKRFPIDRSRGGSAAPRTSLTFRKRRVLRDPAWLAIELHDVSAHDAVWILVGALFCNNQCRKRYQCAPRSGLRLVLSGLVPR